MASCNGLSYKRNFHVFTGSSPKRTKMRQWAASFFWSYSECGCYTSAISQRAGLYQRCSGKYLQDIQAIRWTAKFSCSASAPVCVILLPLVVLCRCKSVKCAVSNVLRLQLTSTKAEANCNHATIHSNCMLQVVFVVFAAVSLHR